MEISHEYSSIFSDILFRALCLPGADVTFTLFARAQGAIFKSPDTAHLIALPK